MAFRASRKSTPAKTTSSVSSDAPVSVPQNTEETRVVAPVLSVDDLVGGPVQQTAGSTHAQPELPSVFAPRPVEKERIDVPTTQPRMAEVPSPSYSSEPQRPHIPEHQPSYRSGNGGGYGQHRGGGRFFHNRGGSMRRDFAPSESGLGQDITVPTETVKGLLDVMPEGHGFLRPKFTPSEKDIYISQSQIRRFLLRNGDMVEGQARAPKDNERYYGLLKVEKIDDQPAEAMSNRPKFEDLTPIYPNKLLKLETETLPLSTRIIDLVAPIGFGQRGLIVSPPKAGKTTIIKEIAAGISKNFPEVHLMAALIGERPEEVTDISRNVHGEVLASNFDESPAEQTRIAEVALDRAKRLVEMGKDVVILLDSITRLARAYNMVVNPSGRTLSGGFDPAALYPAKRFLGAARSVEVAGTEKGGSLTVIGTALVDTGSRMDDLIYEEFKGTGNMELHLSRSLQERRVFPAIDVAKSGTRHDELLLGEENMKKVTTLRHMLVMLSDEERTMMLIDKLGKTKNNQEFLDSLAKG